MSEKKKRFRGQKQLVVVVRFDNMPQMTVEEYSKKFCDNERCFIMEALRSTYSRVKSAHCGAFTATINNIAYEFVGECGDTSAMRRAADVYRAYSGPMQHVVVLQRKS